MKRHYTESPYLLKLQKMVDYVEVTQYENGKLLAFPRVSAVKGDKEYMADYDYFNGRLGDAAKELIHMIEKEEHNAAS